MDDFIAGPSTGGGDDGTGSWGGGAPPPVLLAAMGAALLIAVTLIAFLIGSGGGSNSAGPVPAGAAGPDDPSVSDTAGAAPERVLLTVSVEGGGDGKVLIEPRGATCSETCSHEFTSGTRVTLTADPADGSRFEGWDEACTGVDPCSFFMDREREVTATFEGKPSEPQCDDGKDNDHDGLTDSQDPSCDSGNSETGNDRPAPASDCNDGRDNDSDGLVDAAQDPDCATGNTESGSPNPTTAPPPPVTPPPPPPPASTTPVPSTTPGVSQCQDGIDNDGDGKTDRPADPGCDADGTEAGG
jgi:hypothetical protein